MKILRTTLLALVACGGVNAQVLIGPQNIRNGAVTPPKLDTAGLYTVGGLTALNLTSPLLTVTGGGTSGTIAYNGSAWVFSPALSVGGGGTWGSITGTLSDQTDLNAALGGKQAADADLTAIAALVPSAAGKVLKWNGSAWTAGDDENTTYDLSGYLTSASTLDATKLSGNLPALDGSALTSLNGTNIATGTVADARLSSNVPLKNAANTFTSGVTIDRQGTGLTLYNAGAAATFVLYQYGAINPGFMSYTASGTRTSATQTNSGQLMFWMAARGHSGEAFVESTKAALAIYASQAWSPTANGTELRFHTTANNTTSMQERMRIANDGNVGIGRTSPGSKLDVNGTVTATSFSGPLANALTAGTGLTSTGTYNGGTARTFAVDLGTGATQAAAGNHLHTGVYQGASAALAQLAGLAPTTTGQIIKWNQTAGAWELSTDANSVDAPTDATYITQTPHASLSNEQALSALSTGLLKVENTTGILSTASAGTDYPGLGTSNTYTGTNTLSNTSTTATDTQSLVYERKNGTAAVATNTQVGRIDFKAFGGAAGSESFRNSAAIVATTGEAHDSAAKGGTKLSFYTTNLGATTPIERLTIGPNYMSTSFNFAPDTDGTRTLGGGTTRWNVYSGAEYSRTKAYTTTSAIGTDASTVYFVSGTSTITLPAANVGGSTTNARKVVLIKTDSGTTTTISRAGTDTINKKASGGLTTFTLTQQYESVTLYSDGVSAWFVTAQN